MPDNRYYTGMRFVNGVKTPVSIPCWFSTGDYSSIGDFLADPVNSISNMVKYHTALGLIDERFYFKETPVSGDVKAYHYVTSDASVFNPITVIPQELVFLYRTTLVGAGTLAAPNGTQLNGRFITVNRLTNSGWTAQGYKNGDVVPVPFNAIPYSYNTVSFLQKGIRVVHLVQYPAVRTDEGSYQVVDNVTNVSLDSFTDSDEYPLPTEGPYAPGGSSVPSGGGGSFGNDRENDDLRPLIPSGSVENDLVDAGIFTRYLVTNEQLKEFAKELFTDDLGSALLRELVELMFGKVYDALISVMSYPFAVAELPGITLKAGDIHLGSFDTNAASTGILTKTFTQIDWGNVDINEYWGNFLDYAPHTKIQLFLPWGTGFVDIDPNECMGTSLNVVTNIELSKGTCVHVVSTGNGAILGTYNGFCASQYPITAVDTSGKAISTVIGAVAAVTSIGAGALGKGAAESAYISAANKPTPVGLSFEERLAHQKRVGQTAAVAAARPYQAISKASAATAATSSLAAARLPIHFFRNGSFAANAASMMPQKPFIIMTWPDQSVPSQYGSHVGYPSNIYENLGRLRGYTEVGAAHLDGINCTEHEREELMSLLQGGVIL